MANRAQAVQDDYERSKGGLIQIYYYVNLKALERAGITQFKAEPGDNFARILPPPDTEKMIGRKVFVHSNIGANRDTVLCPNRTCGENNEPLKHRCPICERATAFYEADKKSEAARALFASERWLFFIVNTKDATTETTGVHWYDGPKKVMENIRQLSVDPRTKKAVDISDPKTGQDLVFVRQGTGIGTDYEAFRLLNPSEIPDSWCQGLPSFTDVLYFRSEQEIEELLASKAPEPAVTPAPERATETTTSAPAATGGFTARPAPQQQTPPPPPPPAQPAQLTPPASAPIQQQTPPPEPEQKTPPTTTTPTGSTPTRAESVASKVKAFQARRRPS